MKTVTRSTPENFWDCATVRDKNGVEWVYSEPADVWKLREASGFVNHTSSVSYQKLLQTNGPLTY